MDYRLLADTALLAGEIMLQSGAETYRVEDTMQRILDTSGAEDTKVLVLSTALLVTINDACAPAVSKMQRIPGRGTDLGNICAVNGFSRRLCEGKMELAEVYRELKCLREQKQQSLVVTCFCTLVTVVMFTLLLGATAKDALFAAFSALVMVIFQTFFSKNGTGLNHFMYRMTVLAFATFLVTVLQALLRQKIHLEMVVAGAAMPLLPGLAITNAIRDTLQGDYISGAARVLEAFVQAAACAVGIGAGLYFGNLLTGGVL